MRNLSPEEIERERELFENAWAIGDTDYAARIKSWRNGNLYGPDGARSDQQQALGIGWYWWLASAAVDRSMSSLPLSSEEGGL